MALRLSKLYRLYFILAISVVTAVVLLVILNMIAFTAIEIRNKYVKPSTPSHFLAERQEVYPGISPSDIELLLDEVWNRPFQYEPWVGFKERPRSGKFVNISDVGFRHSCIKDLHLDSSGINIFVFGGSTTFGYGVDDCSTIPSHLQKQLSNLTPDKYIRVFNFGRGFYYSKQELALLLQLISNNHIPTIAIFIDGLNEGQTEPHYSDKMSFLFDAYNYDEDKLLSELVKNFLKKIPLMRAVRKLIGIALPVEKNQPSEENYTNPIDIYKSYLKNKEIITLLSEHFSFHTYFFIQPVPGYHNNFLNHRFMEKNRPRNFDQHMTLKMQLLQKTVNNQNSFDLTHLLENYGPQPFVDDFHYTSDVNELIAATIAQKIKIP